jgi:cyclopropane fatty-acyl-phospholipid synthase-like methyltransferase
MRNVSKDPHGKVGWNSKDNQIIRFQRLLDVGVMNGETILDFGCGYGDLYDYTQKKDLKIKYIGVDINKSYIYDAVEMHKDCDNCKFYISDDIRQIIHTEEN